MENIGPTRVIGYARVSTQQQADEGHSIEAQTAQLKAYAEAFNLELVAIEVDAGESAGSLDRPGLTAALGYLDRFEASALLVVKLDRLTRSVRDFCSLIDTYFKDGDNVLMSISESVNTSNAMGRMVLTILMSVAAWEREAAAERTATVKAHMKASGEYVGGWPPYGYSLDEDGNLTECPPEQMIITAARALRSQGHTLRAVACALGANPRTGKAFSAQQIVRMI